MRKVSFGKLKELNKAKATFTGEAAPDLSVLSNPLLIVIALFYLFFLGGPLEEEFGWRGCAFDRLQVRYNGFISSVILGFIWGLWHLPLFFIPTQTIYYQKPIWAMMVSLVLYAILFTWIYNNTGGSILAAMLFHTMGNLSHFMPPTLQTDLGSLYYLIILLITAIAVLAVWDLKTWFAKKRKLALATQT